MWQEYISSTSVDEVLDLLDERKDSARIVAGATDLILELERGVRKGVCTLIDISRIDGLDQISLDAEGNIHLGPLVTHNQCVASKLIRERALPLALASWEVGSPQIRNRGTIAGNIITASPANDTISPLMALGAKVTLRSKDSERIVDLEKFYSGVRRTVMKPDEMLVNISFPSMHLGQKGGFIKFALRQAQAISLVNVAAVLTIEADEVTDARLTFGAVAPTIVRAKEAEAYLRGRRLTDESIQQAANLVLQSIRPIDDIRASGKYREAIARVVMARVLRRIANNTETAPLPERPPLLWGKAAKPGKALKQTIVHDPTEPIVTTINHKPCTFSHGQGKTLLRLLREEGLLTGTKEGCAEGECGACTVFLDGKAVMACMVPAPRAHNAEIISVEGLSEDGSMNAVQRAFVAEGAVQCGYCTPGFLMSATKLLEENPSPTRDEIRQAITGNLCRCTGYYKIIQAVERAATEG